MTRRDHEQDVPPELAAEYDEYVDVAVDLANGRLSPRREAEVRERMKTDLMFRKVVQPILDAHAAAPMPTAELEGHWTELRERIGLAVDTSPSLQEYEQRVRARAGGKRRYLWRFAAVFAVVLLIPVAIILVADTVGYTERSAEPNVVASVRLPEGSMVLLSPGASVRYPNTLAELRMRSVRLHGEASFTVAPDVNRPFAVSTTRAVVTAVGTKFTVVDGDVVVVTVIEGKVTVQALDDDRNLVGRIVLLRPGARVRVTSQGILDDAAMTQPLTNTPKP